MEMCGEVTGSDFGRQGKRGEACVKKKDLLIYIYLKIVGDTKLEILLTNY